MKILKYACILLLFFSCKGKQTDYLEQALILAGENRPELEKVLQHYAAVPNDSLKYRAAVFLIENMPGHYSHKYPEFIQAYCNELDTAVSLDYDNETNKKRIEQISAKYGSSKIGKTVEDIQILTAAYLINNIDRAYNVWQYGE